MRSFARAPFVSAVGALSVLGVYLVCVSAQRGTHQGANLGETKSAVLEAPHLLRVYCTSCHSSGRAGVDLDSPPDVRLLRNYRPTWQKVRRALEAGKMPPPGATQPSARERATLISWIEREILTQVPGEEGPIKLRRLSRAEYLNALKDLLGISLSGTQRIPADTLGWHRVQTLSLLTPEDSKKYAAAAEEALAFFLTTGKPPLTTASALEFLLRFARRAYRRPLLTHEQEALCAAYDQAQRQAGDRGTALAAALKIVLTSCHFLCVSEPVSEPDDDVAAPRSQQLALAARLAFFFWSSIPDDELLDEAERGTLRDNLEATVERMLRDSRSRALAEHFAPYWLELPKLDTCTLLPKSLRMAMRQETQLLVTHIVRQDRSVLEFLDADYTFLNDELARHYGVPGVHGKTMRLVQVPGTQRAGLFGHGSILTLTCGGGETSPVRRGKWVLGNLLGAAPPPPSSDLLAAFNSSPRSTGPGTVRQLLERHRADPSCAACHARMDAIGFALENFDIAGRWRPDDAGQSIDARVNLDGQIVEGPHGLRLYLLSKKDLFIRCLAGKLLSYALKQKGLAPEIAWLERIPDALAKQGYRFSRLAVEVVKSAPFQFSTGVHLDEDGPRVVGSTIHLPLGVFLPKRASFRSVAFSADSTKLAFPVLEKHIKRNGPAPATCGCL